MKRRTKEYLKDEWWEFINYTLIPDLQKFILEVRDFMEDLKEEKYKERRAK